MAEKPIFDPMIREGIDACRSGHDDLRLPELADVARAVIEDAAVASHFARVQHCDAKIQAALHEVVIPEGLKGRLLARLESTRLDPIATDVGLLPTQQVAEPRNTRRRQRVWFSMALAASLLIAVSLVVAWLSRPAGPLDVVALAQVWEGELAEGWRPMSQVPQGGAIPVRLTVAPSRWKRTSSYLGYKGIAYDVSRPGCRAVLFVVNDVPSEKLPKAPPLTPQDSSGGHTVGAWLVGKQMCILVVIGDERMYRSLIPSSATPLA